MFNNSGTKLKNIATIIFSVIIIVSVLQFIFTLFSYNPIPNFILVLTLALAGYLSCMILSAFGEIAEDVHALKVYFADKDVRQKQSKTPQTIETTSSNYTVPFS